MADDAYLLLSFPNRVSVFRRLTYCFYGRPTSQRDYSHREVRGHAAHLGFREIERHNHSYGFHRTPGRLASLNMRMNRWLSAVQGRWGLRLLRDYLAFSTLCLFRKGRLVDDVPVRNGG